MEDILKPLETIQQVELPSNIYKQIHARIESELDNRLSNKAFLSMAAAFLVLVSLNILIVLNLNTSRDIDQNNAKYIYLISDNSIY